MNDAPRVPPRYLPVLTETVEADAAPEPAAAVAPASPDEALEERLVRRLMQRVDAVLEQQLHDAVASMVLQHTHALVPRLREEVEFVVRQAVVQAVQAELATRPPA